MAVPVQIGGMMEENTWDDEFERAEQWFTPKRIKRILQEWHARYEPWVYQHPDERGVKPMASRHEINSDPELKRTEIAGSVQSALNQLAMREPELYDIIVGMYLDVEPKRDSKRPHVIYWQARMSVFELADWQGCSPRTVYRRELKAREFMAEYLGYCID
jgi:hypothetical protein